MPKVAFSQEIKPLRRFLKW